jgi:hypothetical protein
MRGSLPSFHLHSTKVGPNNLYKRGRLSRLGQIAPNRVYLRRHSCRVASVCPPGRDESSVANGNHRGPKIDQRLVSKIAALSVLCDNHGIRST